MGMTGPKSLLEVKDALTFLDVVVRQILHLRERTGARLPLVLMNSFATREPSLAALAAYPDLAVDAIPADFVQSKVPKLLRGRPRAGRVAGGPRAGVGAAGPRRPVPLAAELRPARRAARRAATSTRSSRTSTTSARSWTSASSRGSRVSGCRSLMEVADRTPADRKGGHLARRRGGGGLVLREVAQTPDADLDAFQDIGRHRYFNTNTLWVDLRALKRRPVRARRRARAADDRQPQDRRPRRRRLARGPAARDRDGRGDRRLRRRAGDPRRPRRASRRSRRRNDLLTLRSDAYELHADGRIVVAERP